MTPDSLRRQAPIAVDGTWQNGPCLRLVQPGHYILDKEQACEEAQEVATYLRVGCWLVKRYVLAGRIRRVGRWN